MDPNKGVPPPGSGHSAEPEPISVASADPASVPNAGFVTLDVWCEKRQAALRVLLGEYRAYMAMRSFIHEVLRVSDRSPKGRDGNGDWRLGSRERGRQRRDAHTPSPSRTNP